MSSYYLGAAIDLSNENPFDIMSKKVIDLDQQCIIFRPDRAYNNAKYASKNSAHYLKKINDFALLEADIAIFYISSKIFSMGAALEIQERSKMHAINGEDRHKKTFVITDKAGLYLQIQEGNGLIVIQDSRNLEDINFRDIISDHFIKRG